MSLSETHSRHESCNEEQDSVRVGVIRMVRAELQKPKSAKSELKPDDELAVLSRQAKQRRESIDAYEEAGKAC